MDIDREKGLIRFTEIERKFTGITEIPVEETDVALRAVRTALARTYRIDPNAFPAGPSKDHQFAKQHYETELAFCMMEQLVSNLGASVVDLAEAITRGEA